MAAEDNKPPALPEPPADVIADEVGLLDGNRHEAERIRSAIADLENGSGIRVRAVTVPDLPSWASSASVFGERLSEAWSPTDPMAVIGYEGNTGNFFVTGNSKLFETVPKYALLSLSSEIKGKEVQDSGPAGKLARMTALLCQKLQEIHQAAHAPSSGISPETVLFLSMLLAIVVLMVVFGRLRRLQTSE